MEVTLALLAEAANATVDGKLNIHAAFSTLAVQQFPASIPQMVLVLRLEIEDADWGQDRWIGVTIFDEDDQVLASSDAQLTLPSEAPGQPIAFFQMFQFVGLSFPAAGDYEAVIEVDEEAKDSVLLSLRQAEPPPEPPE